MTDEEKRAQKANLLLEFQEAEDNLNHLKEKARRKAEMFRGVAEWLKHIGALEPRPLPLGADPAKIRDVIVADTAKFQGDLNVSDVVDLAENIRHATLSVENLGARKSKLGLR